MTRFSGFYWVKRGLSWIVAEWNEVTHTWTTPGSSVSYGDGAFESIGARVSPQIDV